jgi:hypothetical protein
MFTSHLVHFLLSGCVKKHNYCYRAEENPHQLHLQPLHSACVTGVEWQISVIEVYFSKDLMKCMYNKITFNVNFVAIN